MAGCSILAKSTSRAIALRNAAICFLMSKHTYAGLGVHVKTHRLGMPSLASPLKPTQMSTTTRCTQYDIGVQLDLIVWNCLIAHDRIILCVQYHNRNAYVQHTVGAARVSVICTFGRITPGRALNFSIKFVEVCEIVDTLETQGFVFIELFFVNLGQLLQVVAHGFAVELSFDVRSLESEGADFQFPRITYHDR